MSTRVGADDVYARLAESYAGHVQLDGDQVALRLVEPVELITVAREASAIDRFALRAFAATPHAMVMLREDAEPARSSWRWVCETLGLTLDDAVSSFVAGEGSGYLEIDEPLTQPILVLADRDERTMYDQDQVERAYMVFDREPGGWFLRQSRSRGQFSNRRGDESSMSQLYVNGNPVTDGHLVHSGDQICVRYNRHLQFQLEVVAIV